MSRAAIATLVVACAAVWAHPAAAAAPRPQLGRSVIVKPVSGRVAVKPRGRGWVRLREKRRIPLSSQVDTTRGRVRLVSARPAGRTQSGTFSQGIFRVTQRSDGLTDLTLTGGDFSACASARAAGGRLTGAANTRRRLFGRAHGRFRTRGRNSSATVRGTDWLTEDRCTGTVTKNMSRDKTSMVATEGQDQIRFDLEPGQTITYYCNKLRIEPDTYCLILLAQPADGLIAGGILTQIDVPGYYLYIRAPDGQEGAVQIPFSERDANGWRQSVFACPVRQAGSFNVGWSLDGSTLLFPGTLSLTLNVEGPNASCQTEPPTPQPIARA